MHVAEVPNESLARKLPRMENGMDSYIRSFGEYFEGDHISCESLQDNFLKMPQIPIAQTSHNKP